MTRQVYIVDWTNHLWLIGRQADHLRELGHPSFFVSSDRTGILYPFFAFYGGTLYTITGALAVLLGSSYAAYLVSWIGGFAMAYGGTWWLARSIGVSSATAHAPALVVVTSAYFLTNLYGRGAWPEFIAAAALPLTVAAAVALLGRPRPSVRSSALLVLGTVLLTGSHNITFLWAVLFMALLAVVLLPAIGPWIWERRGRVPLVAGLAVCGVATNLWFLLPDVVYAGETRGSLASAVFTWGAGLPLHDWSTILHPGRTIPSGLTDVFDLYVQVPLFAAAWALAACGVHLGRMTSRLRRAVVGVAVVLALFLVMSTNTPLWNHAPSILKAIQFPYRLHTYVVLLVAGLAMLGLLAVQGSRRRPLWLGALVAALAIGAVLAQWQVWTARTYAPLKVAYPPAGVAPQTWYDVNYRPVERPPFAVAAAPIEVQADFGRGRAVVGGRRPRDPGAGFGTNIVWSPLLEVRGGAVDAGRGREGVLVVRATPGRPGTPFTGQVRGGWRAPVLGGAIGTLLGVLGWVAMLGWVVVRRRR